MLRALPPEALLKQRAGTEWDGWTLEVELQAQLVELVSVLAARKQISEPRTVPRPERMDAARPGRRAGQRLAPPPRVSSASVQAAVRRMHAGTSRGRRSS